MSRILLVIILMCSSSISFATIASYDLIVDAREVLNQKLLSKKSLSPELILGSLRSIKQKVDQAYVEADMEATQDNLTSVNNLIVDLIAVCELKSMSSNSLRPYLISMDALLLEAQKFESR